MATTPTLMYRGLLTTTTTTQLYAGVSSGTAIVTNIALTNITSSAATVTINLYSTSGSASFPLLSAVTVPANTTAFFDVKQVLNGTTNAITGGAGTSSAIEAHISGVVIV
jgi:hypothetical protein